ncbi:MAG: HEAT repeat domain-containing protein, partial [Gemmatimonadetes bacterium]|nr:HEAT repeat domain-containing protein [Gemmatimonadota bacterium]
TTGVRRKALEAVAVFRGAAVDRFIEAAARDEESLMRQSALHAMGRTCDPRWLGHVMRAMDSPEAAIRYEATLALGEIAEAEHPEHSGHLRCLRETLDDTDLEVQLAAVTALERIGGEGARRLLREATGSPEPSVAGAAREALEGLAVEDALLDDVGGSLADGRTMYGGFLRPDREDEEGYDWRAREIVVEADEASLDEAYLEDPGAWPRNN